MINEELNGEYVTQKSIFSHLGFFAKPGLYSASRNFLFENEQMTYATFSQNPDYFDKENVQSIMAKMVILSFCLDTVFYYQMIDNPETDLRYNPVSGSALNDLIQFAAVVTQTIHGNPAGFDSATSPDDVNTYFSVLWDAMLGNAPTLMYELTIIYLENLYNFSTFKWEKINNLDIPIITSNYNGLKTFNSAFIEKLFGEQFYDNYMEDNFVMIDSKTQMGYFKVNTKNSGKFKDMNASILSKSAQGSPYGNPYAAQGFGNQVFATQGITTGPFGGYNGGGGLKRKSIRKLKTKRRKNIRKLKTKRNKK
jgi:hypothetical protein